MYVDFASLLGISIGITCAAIGFKTCAIIKGIEKYKSIIKKKKNNRKWINEKVKKND